MSEKVFEDLQVMYIAVHKETKAILIGAKGQYAFNSQGTLARSMGITLGYAASKKGVRPKDLYDIHEIHVCTETQQAFYKGDTE